MYYESLDQLLPPSSDRTRAWSTPEAYGGLPMTPPVAFRRLYEQLRDYAALARQGYRVDVLLHFRGPITPPTPRSTLTIGDPVADCVAEYAARVASRAGLFASEYVPHTEAEERQLLDEWALATRGLFTFEHAVAVDLARVAPDLSLRERETAARAVLSVAAYWYDRANLVGRGEESAHPILGLCPTDAVGIALFDHAEHAIADWSPLPS